MADRIVCTCSNCGGSVLVSLGDLPLGDMPSAVIRGTCPMCSEKFPLGYVQTYTDRTPTNREPEQKREEEKRRAEEQAEQEKAASTASSGAGSDDDWDEAEDSGRSPNDDRSDSMNPNNDAHQAAMDNRADQMNPNNPSYWSSRGGRR